MSDKEKELLKETIKKAIKISSQKLLENKRALGQEIIICENGVIREVEP